jgi:hypothetical protein
VVFPVLGLLPCADETYGTLVGSVIRQDEDGNGQTADEENGVHGALSVEVDFLLEVVPGLSRVLPVECGKASIKGVGLRLLLCVDPGGGC